MAGVQYYGTGRRKKSIARVRLVPGNGKILINGRDIEEYFNYETLRMEVKRPLLLTETEGKFDVLAKEASSSSLPGDIFPGSGGYACSSRANMA